MDFIISVASTRPGFAVVFYLFVLTMVIPAFNLCVGFMHIYSAKDMALTHMVNRLPPLVAGIYAALIAYVQGLYEILGFSSILYMWYLITRYIAPSLSADNAEILYKFVALCALACSIVLTGLVKYYTSQHTPRFMHLAKLFGVWLNKVFDQHN